MSHMIIFFSPYIKFTVLFITNIFIMPVSDISPGILVIWMLVRKLVFSDMFFQAKFPVFCSFKNKHIFTVKWAFYLKALAFSAATARY